MGARAACAGVMTVVGFYVSCVVHNSMHRDVFTHPAVENVWRVILSGVYGFAVEAYRPTHNLNHHVETNLTADHLFTLQVNYRSQLKNLLMFFPTVMPGV